MFANKKSGMNGEKIFITGVTGFVGRHLAEYFYKEGYKVYGLVRNKQKLEQANIPFVKPVWGSLESISESAIEDFSYIIHAAGVITAKNKNRYYEVNFLGTKRLVEIVNKNLPHLKRFLYISSLAAGGPANSHPRSESDIETPVSCYGESKLLGEKEVKKSISYFTILRPPVLFGPYDRGMLLAFKLPMKFGIAPIVGKNNSQVDFLFIDDFIKACFDAIVSPNTKGKEYFLGGNPLYWQEFWSIVSQVSGKKLKTISIPIFIVKGMGYISNVLGNSMLNSDKVKEIMCSNWTSSDEKAKKDFGFTHHTDNLTAIRITYQWYKQKNWL
jgi:nucleoside-diphosphate-sugar epimerase